MLLQRIQSRTPLQAIQWSVTSNRVDSASTSKAARIHTTSRREDHYQTLEVAKGASQQDIKAQFYKLSKKWHPDVNPDSENAVQKFQQVSEAYHTLGSEASRKDYDRSMSGSRYGATRGAGRGQYRYASDNVARRASASYAWDYQRRRSQPRSSSSSSNDTFSQGRSQYHEFGRGGAGSFTSTGTSSMFEQFAQRERRKDAAAAARMNESGKSNSDKGGFASREEHEAHSSSPLIRFAQVAGLFYLVFYFGTRFGSSGEPKRTTVRS